MCSLNMGSMNFGLYPTLTPLQDVQARLGAAPTSKAAATSSSGTRSRTSSTSSNISATAAARASSSSATTSATSTTWPTSLDRKLVKPPLFVQTIFGILGGIGADPDNLLHMRRTADKLFGDDYEWSVLAAGRHQMALATMARHHGRQRPRRARGQPLHRQRPAGARATPSRSPRSAASSTSCRSRSRRRPRRARASRSKASPV